MTGLLEMVDGASILPGASTAYRPALLLKKLMVTQRDSISRSYYAAYCAATSAVVGRNITFAFGRQNPSHDQLPDLILNAGHIPRPVRRKVKTRLYFLRFTRENADYRPHAPINRALALECIYNAVSVIELLGI